MLGLRFDPPGPFWFEDLVFFVIDETSRLAKRAGHAASAAWEWLRRTRATVVTLPDRAVEAARLWRAPPDKHSQAIFETPTLDEPEAWALATEPLTALGAGTTTAVTLHAAASEQLDALTYALAQIRDDLRPVMTYAPLEAGEPSRITALAELDVSIEALLELSRRNAATRPKDRMVSAA